jgi:large subunit ribosomal protein L21
MTAMYAVVKTGGKQYRVAKDDTLIIDHIPAEAGDSIVLDQVLMMVDGDKVNVGAPTVAGAAVGATVLKQTRGPKIMVFRRKRRKNFRRVRGHRQDLTLIKIDDIAADGKLKVAAKPKAEPKPKAEADAAPKKAAAKTAAKTAAKSASANKAGAKKATKAAASKKAAAKKSN